MKTKEELLKIALSGQVNVPYKLSSGFDEADKFLKAFRIKPDKQGKHVPVRVVYYFYYLWVKEDKKSNTPLRYKTFCRRMNKYVKSCAYSDMKYFIHVRCYKLKNFPQYSAEDELQARRIINVQKRTIKAHEKARRNKKILQSKS